ncbi:transposase [Xenorhabdus bovienii]|uniref:Transposase n=1 Tax=Xenorhabdus bovienii TaxID=40576 RepID=A0AAJ1J766_XENBV|nr:transposase [Xenorhabdus bovienii]MDE1489746.1 transposase [Xenorhabdus bovienii]MDE9509160.1 transposase [Xenorhabdus bovienii]MDE9520793.1 transposase [Xenorhabdus bovienii]
MKDIAFILNIELHHLPLYSPSLNPIERLWKFMNEQVRNNYYLTDPNVFCEATHHFFDVYSPRKSKQTRLPVQ